MRRRIGVAGTLALLALALSGCGSDKFPTGKWTATNDTGDVAVMEIRSDGTWALTSAGLAITSGTYSTDKATFTFTTDTYCKEANAEQGTYTWTHANDQLTMKKQTDSCTDRIGVMDGTVWEPAK